MEWTEESVVGYPPRPVPRDKKAATALKKRTLTDLYNTRPQWLADAHAQLDAAVAAAYGWPGEITDDAARHKLLARNRSDCTQLVSQHAIRSVKRSKKRSRQRCQRHLPHLQRSDGREVRASRDAPLGSQGSAQLRSLVGE